MGCPRGARTKNRAPTLASCTIGIAVVLYSAPRITEEGLIFAGVCPASEASVFGERGCGQVESLSNQFCAISRSLVEVAKINRPRRSDVARPQGGTSAQNVDC